MNIPLLLLLLPSESGVLQATGVVPWTREPLRADGLKEWAGEGVRWVQRAVVKYELLLLVDGRIKFEFVSSLFGILPGPSVPVSFLCALVLALFRRAYLVSFFLPMVIFLLRLFGMVLILKKLTGSILQISFFFHFNSIISKIQPLYI